MALVTAATLTDAQRAKLALLQNRATRYEVAVTHADRRRVLLCYTAKHSSRGLTDALRGRMVEVGTFLALPDEARFAVQAGENRITASSGGEVSFTGRTQRQAIMEGELPFILDLVPAEERVA